MALPTSTVLLSEHNDGLCVTQKRFHFARDCKGEKHISSCLQPSLGGGHLDCKHPDILGVGRIPTGGLLDLSRGKPAVGLVSPSLFIEFSFSKHLFSSSPHSNPILIISILQMWKWRPLEVKPGTPGSQPRFKVDHSVHACNTCDGPIGGYR